MLQGICSILKNLAEHQKENGFASKDKFRSTPMDQNAFAYAVFVAIWCLDLFLAWYLQCFGAFGLSLFNMFHGLHHIFIH